MLSTYQKESKAIQQSLSSSALKYNILQILTTPNNCLCQFDTFPTNRINKDRAQRSSGDEIQLTSFKNGCHSDAKVIAATNRSIDSGIVIESVKASKIRNVGTETDTVAGKEIEYSGRLVITYKNDSLIHSLRPIEIPLQFTSDQAGNILECGSIVDHRTRLKNTEYVLDGAVKDRKPEVELQNEDLRNQGIQIAAMESQMDTLDTRPAPPVCPPPPPIVGGGGGQTGGVARFYFSIWSHKPDGSIDYESFDNNLEGAVEYMQDTKASGHTGVWMDIDVIFVR